ncbi:MAG: hypothetical protein HRU80_14145 [Ignavibacteriales bacterium]|nr:MAG: hypothetical protein HRU80_14145 [Ignavibacteriales bacterium]
MKQAAFFTLLIIFLIYDPVFSQDTWNSYLNQVLNVPVESERMKLLDDLMIQTGMQFPAYSRPITHKEWQRYINIIYDEYKNSMSPALKQKIEDYLPDFRFQDNWHFELYGRTVPEVVYSTEGNRNYLTRYEKRSPLFRLNYEASRDTNFGFSIRVNVNNYQPVYTVTGNKTNIPKDPWEDLDFRIFHKAYFSYQSPHAMITLQLGRDNVSWGVGNKVTLLLSDNVPYYDMLKFALWFNEIKFSVIYASLTDYEPQNQFKGSYNDVSGLNKPEKNMLVQRVEYTLANKINFGISYMKIIYGRSPKLGDVNPLIYQHNLFKDYQNSLASADFSASVLPGVLLYGEIASDEINFSGDVKKDGSDPTALSYQFGTRLYFADFFYKAEYVHIAPFMYNHFHYLGRAIEIDGVRYYGLPQRFVTARAMGHYYQPDSRNYSFSIERLVNKYLRLGLSAERRNYGEINLSTPFPAAGYKAKTSPSGIVEKAFITGFHANYFTLRFLSDLNIYYSKYDNFKNVAGNNFNAWEFQFSFGYRFDLI